MNETLWTTLRKLRLSGLAQSLEIRLQEAAGHQLSHAEFLELILHDELAVRQDRLVERRTKAANFRDQRRLDEFDFGFNPSIRRGQIYDLATGRFVRQGRDVLLLGPPGTGKSFIVQAVGQQLIRQGFTVLYRSIFDLVREFLHEQAGVGEDEKLLSRYLKVDLLIIDDMGMKQLPRRSGEYLFEIIMRRYELRSTMMTSNRPLEDWGKLIGDVPSATAILDRFLHHAEMITITGRSYRLRDRSGKANGASASAENGMPPDGNGMPADENGMPATANGIPARENGMPAGEDEADTAPAVATEKPADPDSPDAGRTRDRTRDRTVKA